MPSADVCGNQVVGVYSADNQNLAIANVNKTSNPLSFRFTLTKNSNINFKDVFLAITPADNTSVVNANQILNTAVASNEVVQNTVTNARTILARYSVDTNEAAVFKNGSYTSANSGNIANQFNTATLIDINNLTHPGTTKATLVDANTLQVTFSIRFEGEGISAFPSGNMNVYVMATAIDPITNNIVASDQVGNIMNFTRSSFTFRTDLIKPNTQITTPVFVSNDSQITTTLSTSDRIFSNLTTLNNPANVQTRLYTEADMAGTSITRIATPVNITGAIPIEESFFPAPSQLGYTTTAENQIVNMILNNLDLNPVYRFKLFARDDACNQNASYANLNNAEPWIMSQRGNVFSKNDITNKITSVPTIKDPLNPFLNITPYGFSSNILTSGTISYPNKLSALNLYSINYNELNNVRYSSTSPKYEKILENLKKVTTIQNINLTGEQIIPAGNITQSLSIINNKALIRIQGNLTINTDAICDANATFLVYGNVLINPDFLTQNNSICIIYSNNEISIGTGQPRAGIPLASENNAAYDRIDALLIAENTIRALPEPAISGFKRDGLLVNGAIYTKQFVNSRNIGLEANNLQPSFIVNFPLHFYETWATGLGKKPYSIKEVR
jgi:hypothetical protein